MICNVFLDFFNRDSRQIYGMYDNFPREKHIQHLSEGLNVAVFLCAEFCVLPPGFLAECSIAKDCLKRHGDFVGRRLVRLPLREPSLDLFWEKKQRQYAPFKAQYLGLFDPQNQSLLRTLSGALVTRSAHIAEGILSAWEQGPDTHRIWRPVMEDLSTQQIERLRATPREIMEDGIAVTWPAILERVSRTTHLDAGQLRQVLQNHYLSIYLREYGLKVVTGFPFARADFLLGSGDLSYDYEALGAALDPIGCWDVLRSMSAASLIALRQKPGYVRFRDAFDDIAGKSKSVREVARIFVLATDRLGKGLPGPRALKKYSGRLRSVYGWQLTDGEVGIIGERLDAVTGPASEESEQRSRTAPPRAMASRAVRNRGMDKGRRVAIFVALEMERRILVDRWHLENDYPSPVWTGKLGSISVEVFSPNDMGRVSAAVSTMDYLATHAKPDLLLVAGIAGGFQAAEVQLGGVLVATSIADLAQRKVLQKKWIPEFRHREYATDLRVAKYLQSGAFNSSTWEQSVIRDAEWPDGLRPAIRYGTLASTDEVVSSESWTGVLLEQWPKLLGIEMEAGGVCAAAKHHDLQVAVVRGVSDMADLSKSDTQWRRRAVKTVAHLLETIDYGTLLGQSPVI